MLNAGMTLIIIAVILLLIGGFFETAPMFLKRLVCTVSVCASGIGTMLIFINRGLKTEVGIMLATIVTTAVVVAVYAVASVFLRDIWTSEEPTEDSNKEDKIFWENFIKEASEAEPGDYRVTLKGHLKPSKQKKHKRQS